MATKFSSNPPPGSPDQLLSKKIRNTAPEWSDEASGRSGRRTSQYPESQNTLEDIYYTSSSIEAQDISFHQNYLRPQRDYISMKEEIYRLRLSQPLFERNSQQGNALESMLLQRRPIYEKRVKLKKKAAHNRRDILLQQELLSLKKDLIPQKRNHLLCRQGQPLLSNTLRSVTKEEDDQRGISTNTIRAGSILMGKYSQKNRETGESNERSEILLEDDDYQARKKQNQEMNDQGLNELSQYKRPSQRFFQELPQLELISKKKKISLQIEKNYPKDKSVFTPKFETPNSSNQLIMEAFENEVKQEMESEALTPINNVLEEDSVDSKIDPELLDEQQEGRHSSSQIYPDDSISAQYYCGSSSQVTPSASRGDFTSMERLTGTGHQENTEEVVRRKIRDIEELAREEIDLDLLKNPQIQKISKKGKVKVEFKDENYPYKRHVYNYTPISEEEEGLVSEKLTSMKSHRQSNLTEAESSAVGPGELKLPLSGAQVIEKSRPFIDESQIEDLKNTEDVYYISSKISTQRLASENQSQGEIEFIGITGAHIGFRYEIIETVQETPTYSLFLCKDHKDAAGQEIKEVREPEMLVKIY